MDGRRNALMLDQFCNVGLFDLLVIDPLEVFKTRAFGDDPVAFAPDSRINLRSVDDRHVVYNHIAEMVTFSEMAFADADKPVVGHKTHANRDLAAAVETRTGR